MRIWHPIPCFCLDRKRLLGEHRELHAIWTILTEHRSGYRNHPEVKRWENRLGELAHRHVEQVKEMEQRGYNHKSQLVWTEHPPNEVGGHDIEEAWFFTGVLCQSFPDTWEPIETMRQKLAAKIAANLAANLTAETANEQVAAS